jgi:hypothetical protein
MEIQGLGLGADSSLDQGPHEMKPTPWRVRFVPQAGVGWTHRQAEAAVNAIEKLLFLLL